MPTTPGELNKIAAAVADLLAREGNDALTAEELAAEIAETAVAVYEELQTKSYNLVVLGHFTLDGDSSYLAAVGPLSTRAPQRARGVGEHFAWDYKTRTGTGKFMLVPLIRNPNEAWDEVRREGLTEYVHHLSSITPEIGEPSYEPMRLGLSDEVRSRITADWQMDPDVLSRKFGPNCICGFSDKFACPRHPEGRPGDRQGPG